MAEEQRCQEGHRLCANNCGFFGSPESLNLCSKCYRDFRLKEDQAASAKNAVEKSLLGSSSSSASFSADSAVAAPSIVITEPSGDFRSQVGQTPRKEAESKPVPASQIPGRCAACRKKVGLTGFPCRCGATFCGTHRYAEQHSCTFDFKAAGRDAISRANPVVKADKLDKI